MMIDLIRSLHPNPGEYDFMYAELVKYVTKQIAEYKGNKTLINNYLNREYENRSAGLRNPISEIMINILSAKDENESQLLLTNLIQHANALGLGNAAADIDNMVSMLQNTPPDQFETELEKSKLMDKIVANLHTLGDNAIKEIDNKVPQNELPRNFPDSFPRLETTGNQVEDMQNFLRENAPILLELNFRKKYTEYILEKIDEVNGKKKVSVLPTLVFKTVEKRNNIIKILSNYIEEKDTEKLKDLIEGNNIIEKILFKHSASKLIYFFYELHEKSILTNTKATTEEWIEMYFDAIVKSKKGSISHSNIRSYLYEKILPKQRRIPTQNI